jgi:hypothetical protein
MGCILQGLGFFLELPRPGLHLARILQFDVEGQALFLQCLGIFEGGRGAGGRGVRGFRRCSGGLQDGAFVHVDHGAYLELEGAAHVLEGLLLRLAGSGHVTEGLVALLLLPRGVAHARTVGLEELDDALGRVLGPVTLSVGLVEGALDLRLALHIQGRRQESAGWGGGGTCA